MLASWRADPAEQRPFAWLSLDSRDNDPVRFWSHVLAALRTIAPDAGAGVDDALRSSGGDVTDLALPLLVNALTSLPGPIVLVLDDYHAITSADVHQSVELLVDHLPRTVQVAVAGRSDPPLAGNGLQADHADHFIDAAAGDVVGLGQHLQVRPGGAPGADRFGLQQRRPRAAATAGRGRAAVHGDLPPVGWFRPVIIRIVVDLPDPLGPRNLVTPPGARRNSGRLRRPCRVALGEALRLDHCFS